MDYWLTILRVPQSNTIGISVGYLNGPHGMLEIPHPDASVPQQFIWDLVCLAGHEVFTQIVKECNDAALFLKAHDRAAIAHSTMFGTLNKRNYRLHVLCVPVFP